MPKFPALSVRNTPVATLLLSSLFIPTGCRTGGSSSTLHDAAAADAPTLTPGTWAKQLVLTSNTSAAGVSATSRIERLTLLAVTVNGGTATVQEKTCDAQSQTTGASQITFPAAFVASIADASYAYTLATGDNGPVLNAANRVEILGAHLANPLTDSLPTAGNDPRVYDQDGDGHPGITVDIDVNLLFHVHGQLYLAQRTVWSEQNTQTSPDHFGGNVTWAVEQQTLGGTNALLTSVHPTITPVTETSTSALAKIPDGSTCATIVQQRSTLFPAADNNG